MLKQVLIATTALTVGATAASAETLKLGLATAQTGGLAPYDAPVVEGIHIAVDEINAAGGIGGTTMIEMVEKDVRSDAAQTAIAVQELVDEGVSAIVLPCDADPSLAAAGIVGEAQIPAISTCASSPTLPLIGGDYVFANFPGDNVQATVSASWAHEQGLDTAYILYSPDSQYTTMPLYFADVMKALGGEVVGEATYNIGQPDFSAIATQIAALDPAPKVVMTSAYEPDFPILHQGAQSSRRPGSGDRLGWYRQPDDLWSRRGCGRGRFHDGRPRYRRQPARSLQCALREDHRQRFGNRLQRHRL